MPTGDDLSALLLGYHEQIDNIFGSLGEQDGDERRSDVVGKLYLELTRHTVIEQTFVDPLLRLHLRDGSEQARRQLGEHEAIERALRGLEDVPISSADGASRVGALHSAFSEHRRRQESELLPRLAAEIPADALDGTADRMVPTIQRGASMSHPAVPGGGTLDLEDRHGLTDRVQAAVLATFGVTGVEEAGAG